MVRTVWSMEPVGRCCVSRNLHPRSLGNVTVPGPSPATIFSGDLEEGGLSWTCLQRLENKHHPLPTLALPVPRQEEGAQIPRPATHPLCFWMNSELLRAEGWAAATVCSCPQVGPQTACDRSPLPPIVSLLITLCLQVSDPLLRVGLANPQKTSQVFPRAPGLP